MEKKRIRDFGIVPGRVKTGKRNTITDVPGVLVGHCTVNTEENHTGVTVIIPGPDNTFANHYTAAAYVHNGFGKSAGLVQVEELGTLETPIALTNTLNVGKVWDALAGIVIEQCQNDGLEPMSINPVVGECNDCRINQIQKRAVGEKEVRQAFAAAAEEFEEGDVGAGAGTICYGMKGGIGSSSRITAGSCDADPCSFQDPFELTACQWEIGSKNAHDRTFVFFGCSHIILFLLPFQNFWTNSLSVQYKIFGCTKV